MLFSKLKHCLRLAVKLCINHSIFAHVRANTHLLTVWNMKKMSGNIVTDMTDDSTQKFVMVSNQQVGNDSICNK